MINEDYVSFETAKLLNEKGFDWECETAKFYPEPDYDQESPNGVYAPTLQMAMKWLREKHKIEIRVIYDNDKLSWYGTCNPMNVLFQILLGFGCKSKSYEEACEAAIKYCLEKLI